MLEPALDETGPVFVTTKSALGLTIPAVVLLLSALLGSVVPDGGVTVAVFETLPVAPAATVPETCKVMLPPAGSIAIVPLTVLPLMFIELGQAAPPVAPLQLAVGFVIAAGKLSKNVALLAELGPALRITTVYTALPFGVKVAGPVFEIERSAVEVTEFDTVAGELGAPPAPSTSPVAVLVIAPFALALTFTWKVTIALWPTLMTPAELPELLTKFGLINGILPKLSLTATPLIRVLPTT
jgi:hypothetical protein